MIPSCARTSKRASVVACAGFVLIATIKLGLMAYYSQHMQWVMDEFAQGHGGALVEMGLYSHVDPIKTALPYFAYDLALRLGRSSEQVLRLWRLETFFAALTIVMGTAAVAHRLYRSAVSSGLAVVTLLSFSNFTERAFRVRNDSFATLFAVASLYAALRGRRAPWGSYGSGLLVGAAFLCTQKAVYFILPTVLTVALVSPAGRRWTHLLRHATGIASALLLYAVALGGTNAGSVLAAIFLSPLAKSHHLLVGSPWPDPGRFVDQTLERNPIPYALCGVGLVTVAVHVRRQPTARRAAALYAAVVTLLVFRHPQPWPYVFVMCMPFLALMAPAPLLFLRGRARTLALALVTVGLCSSFARNVAVLAQDDQAQLRVVRQAEAMLAPTDRYFDGVAMVAQRPIAGEHPWWWWDAPTLIDLREQLARGETRHAASILEDRPKLWIWNYRLQQLPELTEPVVRWSTVRVSDVLYVSGRALPPGQSVPFQNLWPGPYRLVRGHGAPSPGTLRVDGAPCPTPCRIGRGGFTVESDDPEPTFLLPADVAPPERLPVLGPPTPLFPGVYAF